MSNSEGSDAGQPRRPAARRAVERTAASAPPPAPEPDAENKKRVHARRPKNPDALNNESKRRRAAAARAHVSDGSSLQAYAHAPVDAALLDVPEPRPPLYVRVTPREPSALQLAQARASTALARADLGDEFGLDAVYESRLRPLLERLCRDYFHIQLQGAHHLPAHGRALLVANHGASLTWDGLMLRTAVRLHHDAGRELRWLVEDEQFHAPFLGTFVSRLGAVRACQDNAERLLMRDELVAVFPEGAKGAQKRYENRHRLYRFGRGGCVKLALRTGAPIIPVAIVSGEPDSAWLSRVAMLSRWVGLARLKPLGLPPLPAQWRILIGEPVREIARQDAEATRDDALVHELNECVRGAVQQLVDESLAGPR